MPEPEPTIAQLKEERDKWKAEAERLQDELLKLKLNMRRKALGILGDIDITPEQIAEWAEERKTK